MRSRGGFNNNPNVIQFRTATKQISLRKSIVLSNKANVLAFAEGTQFFPLQLKRNKHL